MIENANLRDEKRIVRAFVAKLIGFVLFWSMLFFVYSNVQSAKLEPIWSFGSLFFFVSIPLLAVGSLYVVIRRYVLVRRVVQNEGEL
ncbi:hypothetical protein [Phaeobacter sp. 11ANDIMAR09]|uniref:hypothetical protein n=1 Tax=Phaeobacter sp. 11ANDIMAR09 TaxID=1225647 RepID=UPI0006C8BED1|nr:hypothetical protein [Phaeobacter sp. 11ANDIMAR09]